MVIDEVVHYQIGTTHFSNTRVDIMPKGKRTCHKCGSFSPLRSKECGDCSTPFVKATKSKGKTFFKERREFIANMLGTAKSANYQTDMVAATRIFKKYNNDVDFLLKMAPPFKFKDSIVWLITKKGWEYIEKKKTEFYFVPAEAKKIVDFGVKVGEDKEIKRTNLRDFLNE